jgi:hypothetical protein
LLPCGKRERQGRLSKPLLLSNRAQGCFSRRSSTGASETERGKFRGKYVLGYFVALFLVASSLVRPKGSFVR